MKMENHRTTFPGELIQWNHQSCFSPDFWKVHIQTAMHGEDNCTFHQMVFGSRDEFVSVEVQAGDSAVVTVQDHQTFVRLQIPAPAHQSQGWG